MNKTDQKKSPYENFSFSKPAVYQIKVLGELNTDWSDRLQRMQVTIDRKSGSKPISTLIGRMSDQAALSGVLNSLYELHLSVLSVKILD